MIHLSGWIKLPRWLMGTEVFEDSRLWHIYSYLLTQVNYEPRTLRNGIHLDIGECVISQQRLGALLNIPRESLRNQLSRLEVLQLISRRVLGGRKGTLVKVLEYRQMQEKYGEAWPENQPYNHSANKAVNPSGNPPQNKKIIIKEEKKQRVCFDSLDYPEPLATSEVRESIIKWAEYRGNSLSTEQLQSLINANAHAGALYFCRSIEHSIASGWKSVNPAPDDKMLAKLPPMTKPQRSEKERRLDRLDSQLHTVMAKLKTAIDSEKHALLKEKERLIALRDRLEASK